MAKLPDTAPASHWYYPDGKPCHTVECKSRPGEQRNTTIRDARKLGLYPSVTTILKVIGKQSLQDWKVKQALNIALVTPQKPDEPADKWAKRVVAISNEPMKEAATIGSNVHDALDKAVGNLPFPADMEPYVNPIYEWIHENDIVPTKRECTVTHEAMGYAGTVDLTFTYDKWFGVLDYKTRRGSQSYIEDTLQLAAYFVAVYGERMLPNAILRNVIISRDNPGEFEVVKVEDPVGAWKAFQGAFALWKYLKGYDPMGEQEDA